MLKKWYTVRRNRTRFLRYLAPSRGLGGSSLAAQVLCWQLLGRAVPEADKPDKYRQPVGHLCCSEIRRIQLKVSGNCDRIRRYVQTVAEVARLWRSTVTSKFWRIRLQRIPGHPDLKESLGAPYRESNHHVQPERAHAEVLSRRLGDSCTVSNHSLQYRINRMAYTAQLSIASGIMMVNTFPSPVKMSRRSSLALVAFTIVVLGQAFRCNPADAQDTEGSAYPENGARYLDRIYNEDQQELAFRVDYPGEFERWQETARTVLSDRMGLGKIAATVGEHQPTVELGEPEDLDQFTRQKGVMETEPDVPSPSGC